MQQSPWVRCQQLGLCLPIRNMIRTKPKVSGGTGAVTAQTSQLPGASTAEKHLIFHMFATGARNKPHTGTVFGPHCKCPRTPLPWARQWRAPAQRCCFGDDHIACCGSSGLRQSQRLPHKGGNQAQAPNPPRPGPSHSGTVPAPGTAGRHGRFCCSPTCPFAGGLALRGQRPSALVPTPVTSSQPRDRHFSSNYKAPVGQGGAAWLPPQGRRRAASSCVRLGQRARATGGTETTASPSGLRHRAGLRGPGLPPARGHERGGGTGCRVPTPRKGLGALGDSSVPSHAPRAARGSPQTPGPGQAPAAGPSAARQSLLKCGKHTHPCNLGGFMS